MEMKAYLVRVIDSQELVGLYWAKNEAGLYDLVDESCPPAHCEYTPLPEGGIVWEETAPQVPFDMDDEGESLDRREAWAHKFCFTEALHFKVYNFADDGRKWTALDDADASDWETV